jgi:hypothetical protein
MATSGRDESILLSTAIKGGEIGHKLAGDRFEMLLWRRDGADDASDEEVNH